jgi:hypothetical protein
VAESAKRKSQAAQSIVSLVTTSKEEKLLEHLSEEDRKLFYEKRNSWVTSLKLNERTKAIYNDGIQFTKPKGFGRTWETATCLKKTANAEFFQSEVADKKEKLEALLLGTHANAKELFKVHFAAFIEKWNINDAWIDGMLQSYPVYPKPLSEQKLTEIATHTVISQYLSKELAQVHERNLRHIMEGETDEHGNAVMLSPGDSRSMELLASQLVTLDRHAKPSLIMVEAPTGSYFQTSIARVRVDDDFDRPGIQRDMTFIANKLHELVHPEATMYIRVSPTKTLHPWLTALQADSAKTDDIAHWVIDPDLLTVHMDENGTWFEKKATGQSTRRVLVCIAVVQCTPLHRAASGSHSCLIREWLLMLLC